MQSASFLPHRGMVPIINYMWTCGKRQNPARLLIFFLKLHFWDNDQLETRPVIINNNLTEKQKVVSIS